MRPKGLVGESAGTFQLYAGVRGVMTAEDDGMGDDGGSEPVNCRRFGPREGVCESALESSQVRLGGMSQYLDNSRKVDSTTRKTLAEIT